MNKKTLQEYQQIIEFCKKIFQEKHHDYHTAWRVLRLPTITDLIMIKAKRIRSITTKGVQQVADGVALEFVGIINYSIMALMQINLQGDERLTLPYEQVAELYDKAAGGAVGLLHKKNHDYDSAWQAMRVSSMVDIILMKLLRIKSLEDHAGKALASEGAAAGYQDIINYGVFALLLLGDGPTYKIQIQSINP